MAKHLCDHRGVSPEDIAMEYNQGYYKNIWHRILNNYTPSSPIRDFGDVTRARILSRLLRRFITDQAKHTVALTDFGCGNWLYLGALYRVFAASPNMAVTLQGVDYSEEAMTFGLTKFHADRPPNVHVETQTGELKDILAASQAESLDCIVCLEVLEHVPYDTDALQEYCRLLRPGGILILSVPNSQPFPLSLNWFEYRFAKKAFTHKDEVVGHLRRYHINDMLVRQASAMHVLHIEPYGFFSSDYVKKVASWLDKHTPFLGKLAFPVFRWILFLEHTTCNYLHARKSEGFFLVLQKEKDAPVCL